MITRRAFEQLALIASPVAYAAAAVAGVLRYLTPLAPPRRKSRLVVGPSSAFEAGKVERVELNGRAVYVLRGAEGLIALDAACTHLDCNVNWREKEGAFVCPCHGARFDREGKATRKPGVGTLRRRTLAVASGEVVLLDEPPAAG